MKSRIDQRKGNTLTDCGGDTTPAALVRSSGRLKPYSVFSCDQMLANDMNCFAFKTSHQRTRTIVIDACPHLPRCWTDSLQRPVEDATCATHAAIARETASWLAISFPDTGNFQIGWRWRWQNVPRAMHAAMP